MTPHIIPVYGVNGVGKSLFANFLLSNYLENYEGMSTDNLRTILRRTTNPDHVIQQSSYCAWTLFGEETRENTIKGFKLYRDAPSQLIKFLLDRAIYEGVNMVFEGIHFNPETYFQYGDSIRARPVLITVKDESTHIQRLKDKCQGRQGLYDRIMGYFHSVRSIQEFLIQEAEEYNIPVIDNDKDTSKVVRKVLEVVSK